MSNRSQKGGLPSHRVREEDGKDMEVNCFRSDGNFVKHFRGKPIGKWNRETEARALNRLNSLGSLQPACELQDLVFSKQGHLRTTDYYLSSLTRGHSINHLEAGRYGGWRGRKRASFTSPTAQRSHHSRTLKQDGHAYAQTSQAKPHPSTREC